MSRKMRCVCWLLVAFTLCVCGSAGDEQRWKMADCSGLGSMDQLTECIWQQRLKLRFSSTESLLASLQQSDEEDGDQEKRNEGEEEEFSPNQWDTLSGLSQLVSHQQLPSVRPQRSGERPTYSMEHFRWGKPMSRKRRPVKVYTSVLAAGKDPEESMETLLSSLYKRQLQGNEERKNKNEKSTAKYRITHFRWSAPPSTPPATKRYGGFMKLWPETSHNPMLTLLRTIINKDSQ